MLKDKIKKKSILKKNLREILKDNLDQLSKLVSWVINMKLPYRK